MIPSPLEHTFVFADLAGFTALTEAHGDIEAADAAEAFAAGVRARLAGHEATEVKTIGDAMMLHVADAARALCLAECIVDEIGGRHGALGVHIGGRHGALGVRVGVHTGPAVERSGDWFGATVNVAARVAAEAVADEVLLTRAAADAGAPTPPGASPSCSGRAG